MHHWLRGMDVPGYGHIVRLGLVMLGPSKVMCDFFIQFKVNGAWMTWIDYDRFHELVGEHVASNGTRSFTALDYMARTPDWAIFGAQEQGFDPQEERFFRTKRKYVENDGADKPEVTQDN